MPTILTIDGVRFVIYPNDHRPAHVHVMGPGWVVVVQIGEPSDPEIREVIGCNKTQAGKVLRMATEHRQRLLEGWENIHG